MFKKMDQKKKLILICSLIVVLVLGLLAGAWFGVSAIKKEQKKKEIAEKLQNQYEEKISVLKDLKGEGSLEDYKFVLSNHLTSNPEEVSYFIEDMDADGTNEFFLGKKSGDAFVIYNIFTGIREGDMYSVYNGDGLVLLEGNVFITEFDYALWLRLQEEPDLLQARDEDGKVIEGKVSYQMEDAWIYASSELVETTFPETIKLKEFVLSAIE